MWVFLLANGLFLRRIFFCSVQASVELLSRKKNGGNDRTAFSPGKLGYVDKRRDEIEEGPGDDDAVVDVQPEHDRHGRVPDPLEDGDQLPDHGQAARPEILAGGHLLVKPRESSGHNLWVGWVTRVFPILFIPATFLTYGSHRRSYIQPCMYGDHMTPQKIFFRVCLDIVDIQNVKNISTNTRKSIKFSPNSLLPSSN